MKLVVANPVAESTVRSVPPAPRAGDLDGKTVGLYWNIKAGGDKALDRTERVLRARYPSARFVRLLGSIGSTVRHLTPRDADRVASTCQVTVGTTGD
ncbi:MAG: hypothetical protein KGJ98_00295 [Chloroflexota bacterium]|nr:hypothetical protein [Chloroflexota bacterium]